MASSSRRGWLDKKPSSGRSGSWQRRWVVLRSEAGSRWLAYYTSASAVQHDVVAALGRLQRELFADA